MTSDLVLGGQKNYLAKNFIKIGRKTKFYEIWVPRQLGIKFLVFKKAKILKNTKNLYI